MRGVLRIAVLFSCLTLVLKSSWPEGLDRTHNSDFSHSTCLISDDQQQDEVNDLSLHQRLINILGNAMLDTLLVGVPLCSMLYMAQPGPLSIAVYNLLGSATGSITNNVCKDIDKNQNFHYICSILGSNARYAVKDLPLLMDTKPLHLSLIQGSVSGILRWFLGDRMNEDKEKGNNIYFLAENIFLKVVSASIGTYYVWKFQNPSNTPFTINSKQIRSGVLKGFLVTASLKLIHEEGAPYFKNYFYQLFYGTTKAKEDL